MYVRDFMLGDEPALHAVFYSAVHAIARSDYSAAQLNAWAGASWPASMRGPMNWSSPGS